MGRADSLSRRVDWAEGVEKDNKNQGNSKERMARSKRDGVVDRGARGRNCEKN